MNRFDRVIAILTLLQTKRVVTAQEMAERFTVSERTIYRDLRTLENAGVPIGAEAGVGYYLDKSYRLPPIMFARDEAVSLLLAEKFIKGIREQKIGKAYLSALDKVKAVLGHQDQDYLDTLAQYVDVHIGPQPVTTQDQWLDEIQQAVVYAHPIAITYFSHYSGETSKRTVEPIGLYYYSRHWHLIAWCRSRNNYRDFRIDRILELTLQKTRFERHQRASLQEYLRGLTQPEDLHRVVIRIKRDIAPFMQNQKYYYGFVDEQEADDLWLEMTFLISELEYFARWIMSYTDAVKILEPTALTQVLQELMGELQAAHGLKT